MPIIRLTPADRQTLLAHHRQSADPNVRLRSSGLVCRPRPVIRPKDPDREKEPRTPWALLTHLPPYETAVFMDKAVMNLNPKVGCPWMRRGHPAAVETPGTNEK